jgi:hypothetical protein
VHALRTPFPKARKTDQVRGLSRSTRNVIGAAAATINSNDGPAARAKNASSAAVQIDVARVRDSIGPRINVAGNSFIVSRNTITAAAARPGRIIGTVMVKKAQIRERPKLIAASSILGLTCKREDRIVPTATGRNKTT